MNRLNYKSITILATVLAVLFGFSASTFATDLDDDIGSDEPINDDLRKDQNTEFIVVNAKAKANAKAKRGTGTEGTSEDGAGNINIGVGVDLSGATIINLSDNEGATVVSD